VVVKAGGAILRHGTLYGPGVLDYQIELLRKRQFPLVGGGTGYCSWEREEIANRFFDAFREGDVGGLVELLAADVQIVGDSGGKAPQWGRGIFGADNVGRLLATMVPAFVRIGVVVEPREVNGQPGAIFHDRDGKVLNTLALDMLDGRIQTIRAVINPDKLRHLGPVADAWAVLREANQARGPSG
jgi:RNA polymerase sigma-70 factor, ECF subfamily